MAAALARGPYVGGGLGEAFAGGRPAAAWVGAAAAGAIATATADVAGGAAVVSMIVVALAVVALGRRRLGGVTGDVLGAAGILGETAGLVVATASW
jgi:adenosylcobinamide-GDP ribazoletransferase